MGSEWAAGCQLGPTQRCTLPHLMGLCKLQQWTEPPALGASASGRAWATAQWAVGALATAGATCASLFTHSGAPADVLLAVLLWLQHRLFISVIYRKVVMMGMLRGCPHACNAPALGRERVPSKCLVTRPARIPCCR